MTDERQQKNSKLAVKLVVVALLMFGFGYALVPLYNVLCDLAGQNTRVDSVAKTETSFTVDASREVSVELLTALNKSIPLEFKVETPIVKLHPGEYRTVKFFAKNISKDRLKARAVATFSPGLVKDFVIKTICFCELEQIFEPNETKDMSVRFVVDPALPEKYKTITLSYTFFDITQTETQ
ncbi:MAG: cytochrome c oxidase assembly protein [Methylomonas sp.]|nr:cytochrome c oxidase assembly protein [Methylomonas sp.]PPD21422.1 MAG: cytochrome c oxidase assembly protein [Methylomonas sp.]PPD25092.1 MAG: cytochrome c oxidase assembly protein [Methylomonas sp.]PPD34566.1 MAG: cytochrome c oxidase assembly protein [Methylomonas sp.]PPD41453.1 MAG: cytochrome c oxidase assembly protein [Methylomonas sp.]